jgi:hypothetical protein
MKIGEVYNNDVYYRLYKSSHDNLMHVVCMQNFDENDYFENNFVKNDNGEKYYFDKEEEAIQKLNEWFTQDEIAVEYRINKLIR